MSFNKLYKTLFGSLLIFLFLFSAKYTYSAQQCYPTRSIQYFSCGGIAPKIDGTCDPPQPGAIGSIGCGLTGGNDCLTDPVCSSNDVCVATGSFCSCTNSRAECWVDVVECGDGIRDNGEDCSTCPADVVATGGSCGGSCGDGVCRGDQGENACTCNLSTGGDCGGSCSNCGNNRIDAGENCDTCPADVIATGGSCTAPPAATCSIRDSAIQGNPSITVGELSDRYWFRRGANDNKIIIEDGTLDESKGILWTLGGGGDGIKGTAFVDSSGNELSPNDSYLDSSYSTTSYDGGILLRGKEVDQGDRLRARIYVTGPGGDGTCRIDYDITVQPPGPWFQTRYGNIISGGNITNVIPSQCTLDSTICTDQLIIEDTANGGRSLLDPGLVISQSQPVVKPDDIVSDATVSTANWVAQTSYSGLQVDFDYFSSLVNSKNPYVATAGQTIKDAKDFASINSDGYTYIKFNSSASSGDIPTGNGRLQIGNQKLIVLVDGNVNINTRGGISVNEENGGFFLLVASGNISVASNIATVRRPGNGGQEPEEGFTIRRGDEHALEGIYFANGQFVTNTNGSNTDKEFSLNGMVVAKSGFRLLRNRGTYNENNPAEVFEYSPEFAIHYPTSLGEKNFFSREVNP